jgi:hypothetical protein
MCISAPQFPKNPVFKIIRKYPPAPLFENLESPNV